MISTDGELLSHAVEAYLVARYPGRLLAGIYAKRWVQEEDRMLANQLHMWRSDAGWPSPGIIGVRRCVSCHQVMDDEPSACEDETVCTACVVGDDGSGGAA